jgi:dGTPase
MIHDRAALIAREDQLLQPYALRSSLSEGRLHDEPEDLTRTPFQKDRDRIIHCRAFRRLKMKTQVFVAHYGDHYRTRITHSLETAQVSRDIARSLGLNEDAAETIALAHDLGHTPFGHAGEHALNELMQPFGREFEHNQQSKRIVEELEQVYPQFRGLNLTFEVRQGLMKHQSPWDQAHSEFHGTSLEAQIVNLADEIAYNNHDVDDGLRSGLITEETLAELPIWRNSMEAVERKYGVIENAHVRRARLVSNMIGLMIGDLIRTSSERIDAAQLTSLEDVYRRTDKLVQFSEKQSKMNRELKEFLSKNMYFHPRVVALSDLGQQIIRDLFKHYLDHPEDLPKEEQASLKTGAPLEVLIQDYIAGMTDDFAQQEWQRLTQTND